MSVPYRRPLSVTILLVVNALTLLLSIAVLAEGIWIKMRNYNDCSSRLQWLVISIGIIMFVLSLIGFAGARRGSVGLLWLYLAILTIVIILLIIFTILAFVLRHHGSGLLRGQDCSPDFLFRFKRDWGTIATISLIVLVLLLLLYAAACFAFMHALQTRAFGTAYV